MKKSTIVLLGAMFLFSSCQHLGKNSSAKPEYKLKAFWVKDTLNNFNVGFRKVNRFTPFIYKNLIVTGNSFEGLVAYDLESKNKKWEISLDKGVESSGYVVDSYLFVGGLNGIFYAIDLDSAKILWQFDTKSELVSEPYVQQGIVYFLSGSQMIYALEAMTGRQVWVYNRQDTTNKMTIRGGARPVISGSILYQGFNDGSLVALNAKTGTPQWEVLLNRNSKFKDIDATPLIDGDFLYINSYDDKIYAVSKSSGTILWKSDFGGSSQPLLIGDRLYYTSSKGHLVCVNKANGQLIWKKTDIKGIATDPINHKGLVVVGESQGSVRLIDSLNGRDEAAFDPGRGILSRIYSDQVNKLYFISGEANVWGLEISQKNLNNFSLIEDN